jgi:hypothetical protein
MQPEDSSKKPAITQPWMSRLKTAIGVLLYVLLCRHQNAVSGECL